MVTLGGADPDALVYPGQPKMYGTPDGPMFGVPAGVIPVTLWSLYQEAAAMALTLAQAEYETERDAMVAAVNASPTEPLNG